MEVLKSWSLIICTSCIICTLIDLLIPRGKMQKTLQMIINLFIIGLAASSFRQSLKDFKLNIKNTSFLSNLAPDTKLLKKLDLQMSKLATESIRSIISEKLKSIDVIPKKIEIFMDTNSDNCIVMIRCKIYLENKYNSLKPQVYEEVAKKLNIPAEIIDV